MVPGEIKRSRNLDEGSGAGPNALVAAQWRGDTALTLPFSGGIRGRAFTLSSSPPTWSPSLISHLASVNVKQNVLVLEVVSPRQLLKGAPRRRRKFRAQELGESRGGRPEGAVLNKPTVSVDVKQHFNNRSKFA